MRKTRRRTWHVYLKRGGWMRMFPALHAIVTDASSRNNAVRLAFRYFIARGWIKRQPPRKYGAFVGLTVVPDGV
jgi:hypothetical protein